jgi:hypothetical protein
MHHQVTRCVHHAQLLCAAPSHLGVHPYRLSDSPTLAHMSTRCSLPPLSCLHRAAHDVMSHLFVQWELVYRIAPWLVGGDLDICGVATVTTDGELGTLVDIHSHRALVRSVPGVHGTTSITHTPYNLYSCEALGVSACLPAASEPLVREF